jgi:hypothetical protein
MAVHLVPTWRVAIPWLRCAGGIQVEHALSLWNIKSMLGTSAVWPDGHHDRFHCGFFSSVSVGEANRIVEVSRCDETFNLLLSSPMGTGEGLLT